MLKRNVQNGFGEKGFAEAVVLNIVYGYIKIKVLFRQGYQEV